MSSSPHHLVFRSQWTLSKTILGHGCQLPLLFRLTFENQPYFELGPQLNWWPGVLCLYNSIWEYSMQPVRHHYSEYCKQSMLSNLGRLLFARTQVFQPFSFWMLHGSNWSIGNDAEAHQPINFLSSTVTYPKLNKLSNSVSTRRRSGRDVIRLGSPSQVLCSTVWFQFILRRLALNACSLRFQDQFNKQKAIVGAVVTSPRFRAELHGSGGKKNQCFCWARSNFFLTPADSWGFSQSNSLSSTQGVWLGGRTKDDCLLQ